MSATEVSPSQGIEASLLSYNNSPPPSSPFTHQVPHQQHSSADARRSLSPQSSRISSPTEVSASQPSRSPREARAEPATVEAAEPEDIAGQNHDRMVMDLDPAEPPPPAPPSIPLEHDSSSSTSPPPPTPPSEQSGEAAEPQPNAENMPPPPVNPPESVPPPPANAETEVVVVEEPPAEGAPPPPPPGDTAMGEAPNAGDPPPPAPESNGGNNNNANESGSGRRRHDSDESSDDDSDGGDDDDDSYHGDFLAQLQEDTSEPTAAELAELERNPEESALDHTRWESKVFTALDDPAYVAGARGKIEWTIKGFHGTKEHPNRERILRSNPVEIGGYWWNLKLFPHGNEGTDQLSVYVECRGKVEDESKEEQSEDSEKTESKGEDKQKEDDEMHDTPAPEPVVEEAAPSSTGNAPPQENDAQAGEQLPDGQNTTTAGNEDANNDSNPAAGNNSGRRSRSHSASTAGSIPPPPPIAPFEVAAQIGCVMYNPAEPRVHFFHQASHQFETASRDWGWVRFYGPWNSIHQRRPRQRQAMLRNDTLALTAFVRVVKDPTHALWWKPVDGAAWDSVAKTGWRGVTAEDPAGNAFVAAFVPWLHLEPVRRLVLDAGTPKPVHEPRKRVRPMLEQLRELLYAKHAPHDSSSPASLYQVERVLDWYEHQFVGSTDIIELWESMRNILNLEVWNASSEGTEKHDVLGFIKTFRQDWHPQLPADPADQDAAMDTGDTPREPRSVQDVLDDASKPGHTGYKDWEGFAGPVAEETPDVLQVELHRQRYDVKARKWKKLCHRIRMNDHVIYSGVKYALFAMVVHKGELGSGRFYPIVRPGGAGALWARYKNGFVTYVTHRQAVDSHEGRGEGREGTDSVAYLVSYVRADKLPAIAPVPPPAEGGSSVLGPLEAAKHHSAEDLTECDLLPVVVHDRQAFAGRAGVGYVDPWAPDPDDATLDLVMPPRATLADVRTALVERGVARHADHVRLWPMKTTTSTLQCAPRLETLPTTAPLAEFAHRMGGLHLWMHASEELKVEPVPVPPPPVLPGAQEWDGNHSPPPPPPPAADQPAPSTPPVPATSARPPTPPPPAFFPDLNLFQPAEPQPPPPPPPAEGEGEGEGEGVVSMEGEDVVMGGTQDAIMGGTQDAPPSTGAQPDQPSPPAPAAAPEGIPMLPPVDLNEAFNAMVQAANLPDDVLVPPPPEALVPPPQDAPAPTSDAPAPPSDPVPPPAPQDPPAPESVPMPEPPPPEWPCHKDAYLFVKLFDPAQQTVTGLGAIFAPTSKTLAEALAPLAALPADSFKLHWETESLVEEPELTLSNPVAAYNFPAGAIVVATPHETPAQAAALEAHRAEGLATTAPQFFQALSFLAHFAYQGAEHVDSYFGGPYTRGPLRQGRACGDRCVTIDDSSGDAYVGACVAGAKSGAGVMYYANGDTYEGAWARGLPEGHGTMVYHGTGNRYVGGWKAGRRHGKGVMNFEVADEELQLCRICYEAEMDALFYRCGHVAACEACARQVRDCPVCRRQVDAVVRIWRT